MTAATRPAALPPDTGPVNPAPQPLYLLAPQVRVDVDTSGRLLIHQPHRPVRALPLRWVSRIVANGASEFSARALHACLRGGVPIAHCNGDGKAMGWTLPVRRRTACPADLLQQALGDAMWSQRWPPWIENRRLAAAARVLRACGLPAAHAHRRDWRTLVCNAHPERERNPGRWADALAGQVHAAFTLAWLDWLGNPAPLARGNLARDPGHELAQPLGWLAHIDVHRDMPQCSEHAVARWAVHRFQITRTRWSRSIAQTLLDFEQFLHENWR